MEEETYRLIRFTFDSEVGETVPCYLLSLYITPQ